MPTETTPLTLVVADWATDPHAVVAACTRHADGRPDRFALLVPAWLHGLDWTGDPTASEPCAQRQLERLGALFHAAGIDLAAGAVGDPDPATAMGDAVAAWSPCHVILCVRERRLAARHPLDLVHRAQRATGLPVTRVALPAHGVSRSCR
jgi:hypothetical protein